MIVALAVLFVQAPLAQHAATVQAAVLAPADMAPIFSIEADDSAFVSRVEKLCGPSGDLDALLRAEIAAAAEITTSASRAVELACIRARLDAGGATGRPGPLMHLGEGWGAGAQRALLHAAALNRLDSHAADLLAVLSFDAPFRKLNDSIAPVLADAVDGSAGSPVATRGCVVLNHAARNSGAAAKCLADGLARGVDSTWLLLHATRIAASEHDTGAARAHFSRAINAARGLADWMEIGWHIKWFADIDEWQEWTALTDSKRAAWVRDRFAARDIRDGQRIGSRVMEHFRRLEHVDSSFRVDMSRRTRTRTLRPAVPESRIHWRQVVQYWEPGLIPARPYRFAERWAVGYDDRATVWMRFGAPLTSRTWAAIDTILPPESVDRATNTRAVWAYKLHDATLFVSFESEQFVGSVEATRLVEGVLGTYFCGLDTWRCGLSSRSEMAGHEGGLAPLSVDQMELLRASDRQAIAIVTGRDDNGVPSGTSINILGQVHRVWNPATNDVLAVVPWAVELKDLEHDSVAMFDVIVRQWSAAAGEWLETSVPRTLRLPREVDRKAYLTGYFVVPSRADISAWGVVASQGSERRGRSSADRLAPLGGGGVAVSDLVVGAAAQGHTWITPGGRQVALAPLGAVDRKQPVSLYWQVRSTALHEGARTTIALYHEERRDSVPAIQISFVRDIAAGIDEVERELDVTRLDGGAYRLEVVVARADGMKVRRSARLLLH